MAAELQSADPAEQDVLHLEVLHEFHQEDAEVCHGYHGECVRTECHGNDHPTVAAIWWVGNDRYLQG